VSSARLTLRVVPGLHPVLRQPAQDLGVTLAGDQRFDHVLGRDRGQRAGHRRPWSGLLWTKDDQGVPSDGFRGV